MPSLAYPATWNKEFFIFFYIMTHEYYDSFKFFNVYAFIRRRKLFVAKKEVSEGDARGHI